MIHASLALRLTGMALAASLVALLVAGFVISALLHDFVEDSFDQVLDNTMLSLMANAQYDEALGRLVLHASASDPRFEQPLSGWYWTMADANGEVFRSASLWTADLTLGGDAATGPQGETLRVARRQFTVPGGTTPLQVVATAPRAAIDGEVGRVVTPLVIALTVLGASLALTQLLQVRIGLKPLRRMGRNLARIKSGEIDRLPKEAYVELEPLIGQMNGLLDHNQDSLRRTRDHIGNLAHALKTPLAVIQSEMARSDGAAGRDTAIENAVQAMDRQIAHHLRRARTTAPGAPSKTRVSIKAVIDDLLPVFRGVYADRQLAFSAAVSEAMVFVGDRQDLEELLGNLLDNASKWASSAVFIMSVEVGADWLSITVQDDGPGMATDQLDQAGERGRRFDESRPGSGLGLSIVQDIAALYGGSLNLAPGLSGGMQAVLKLPR